LWARLVAHKSLKVQIATLAATTDGHRYIPAGALDPTDAESLAGRHGGHRADVAQILTP